MARTRIAGPQLASSAILLGHSEITASQGSITTVETDLTGHTVTFTADGNRKVEVELDIHMYSTVAGDFYRIFLKEGATILDQYEGRFQTNSGQEHFFFKHITSSAPSAGSHTYKYSLVRSSGTGTLNTFPSADRRDYSAVKAI